MSVRTHVDNEGNPVLIVTVLGGESYAVPVHGKVYAPAYDEDGVEKPVATDNDPPEEKVIWGNTPAD